MNRHSQTRMTNEPWHTRASFDIRASDFFRHLSFVIRHLTPVHGPNAFEKTKDGSLSMNLRFGVPALAGPGPPEGGTPYLTDPSLCSQKPRMKRMDTVGSNQTLFDV